MKILLDKNALYKHQEWIDSPGELSLGCGIDQHRSYSHFNSPRIIGLIITLATLIVTKHRWFWHFILLLSSICSNTRPHKLYTLETQFNCQKTFLFKPIQSIQTVLIQLIQFSISTDFVSTQLNVTTVQY